MVVLRPPQPAGPAQQEAHFTSESFQLTLESHCIAERSLNVTYILLQEGALTTNRMPAFKKERFDWT